jgi:hypothetical protein
MLSPLPALAGLARPTSSMPPWHPEVARSPSSVPFRHHFRGTILAKLMPQIGINYRSQKLFKLLFLFGIFS